MPKIVPFRPIKIDDRAEEQYAREVNKALRRKLFAVINSVEVLTTPVGERVEVELPLPPEYFFRYGPANPNVGQGSGDKTKNDEVTPEKSDESSGDEGQGDEKEEPQDGRGDKEKENNEDGEQKEGGKSRRGESSRLASGPNPAPGEEIQPDSAGEEKTEAESQSSGEEETEISEEELLRFLEQQASGAGGEPGEHERVKIDLAQLYKLLLERFRLPRLKLKPGWRNSAPDSWRRRGYKPTGPEGRLAVSKTYERRLRRAIAMGKPPGKTPYHNDDLRYPRFIPKPKNQVVVVFIHDISGSTAGMICLLEKIMAFLIWMGLQEFYPNIKLRLVLQEAVSWFEDDKKKFGETVGLKAGGGTKFYTAYELVHKEITKNYQDHNIFIVHATDADDESVAIKRSLAALSKLLDISNLFVLMVANPDRQKSNSLEELTHFLKALHASKQIVNRRNLVIGEVNNPEAVRQFCKKIFN